MRETRDQRLAPGLWGDRPIDVGVSGDQTETEQLS